MTVAESDVDWMKSVIVAVRTIRGEMNLSPGIKIPMMLPVAVTMIAIVSSRLEPLIVTLAKLTGVTFVGATEPIPASSTQLVGQLEVHVPIAGLIDVEIEVARLEKQLKKLESGIKGLVANSTTQGLPTKRQPMWLNASEAGWQRRNSACEDNCHN